MKLSILSETSPSPREYWEGHRQGLKYWKGQWIPRKPTRARRTSQSDKLLLQMAKEGQNKPEPDSSDPYQKFLGIELQTLLKLPQFRRRMLKANSTWVS
jgi:hypothetical protein